MSNGRKIFILKSVHLKSDGQRKGEIMSNIDKYETRKKDGL